MTMNHNIAFLHQFILDKKAIVLGRWKDTLLFISKIIRTYRIVRRFRDRLYDTRKHGITYARLAEVHKLQALIFRELNRRKRMSRVCQSSLGWSNEAFKIFKRLPDPERFRQVEGIMNEIKTIYGDR